MKYLFVFLATILLHVSTTLSAQTNLSNFQKPVVISAKVGSQSGTFKRFAIFDLPGFYTDYDVRSLGIEVAVPLAKRVVVTANYIHESGKIQKVIGLDDQYFGLFFTEVLVSSITNTPVSPTSFDPTNSNSYTATASVQHFQIGTKLNMVAQKQFRLFTAIGYGLSGGQATYKTLNNRKEIKKLDFKSRFAITPLGMEFGDKIQFQVSVGVLDAPNISMSAGMKF